MADVCTQCHKLIGLHASALKTLCVVHDQERTEARTKRREGLTRPATFPLTAGRPPLPDQKRRSPFAPQPQHPPASSSVMGTVHNADSMSIRGIGRSSSSPATVDESAFPTSEGDRSDPSVPPRDARAPKGGSHARQLMQGADFAMPVNPEDRGLRDHS